MPRLPGPEQIPKTSQRGGVSIPRVPQTNLGAEIGGALKGAADVLLQAEERSKARDEAIERLRLQREFRIKGGELIRNEMQTGDIASPDRVTQIGAAINQFRQEIISRHTGREDSRVRLEAALQPTYLGMVGQVAESSVKAQQNMFDAELDQNRNEALVAIRSGTPFDSAVENMVSAIADMPITDAAKRQRITKDVGLVADTRITDIIESASLIVDPIERQERLGEAEDFIEKSARVLNPRMQEQLFGRINKARIELTRQPPRILTDDETSQLGFPEGVIVQKKSNGEFSVVFKPERDEKVRDQKIEGLTKRFAEQGMDEKAARAKATDITDGNIRMEIVPQTGEAREINEVTGEVKVVPLGGPEIARPQVPKEQTLFELARTGNIAGIVPATQEFLGETVGQIPGVPVATDVIEARQSLVVAQNELIRALSVNPRFPVAEINRIRKEIRIEPSILDSERALLARMVGIAKGLKIRLATEKSAAANLNLPQDVRGQASQAAKDIQAFLDRLGVPENFDPSTVLPKGIPDFSKKIGRTQDGKDVWLTPDGRRLVVE